ncbi:fungal-specific transcription factor domain-containing protein [Podospora didyma]|uniref:Fungal-specific transcription factor domain-containing protein n=1 Tax=Podospora didyma TaxID=330526 RepID=A0AAE0NU04_9PEZI|nr:fungal-specific transcription factor domain-containing protein [Podospora didyma]
MMDQEDATTMAATLETPARNPSTTSPSAVFDAIPQPRSVKRPRPVKSCIECRKRKLKCDRLGPCSQCQKSRRHCRYAEHESGAISDDISEGEAGERSLKRTRISGSTSVNTDVAEPSFSNFTGMHHVITRLDRLEKLIVERLSPGTTRALTSPTTIHGLFVKRRLGDGYHTPSNGKIFLRLFDEATDLVRDLARVDSFREPFARLQNTYQTLQKQRRKSLEPIPVFVNSIVPIQERMADILPPKVVCDRLFESHLSLSEPLYQVVHIPTFQQNYATYWEGNGCYDAFLPQLLCMLCIGSRFGTNDKGLSLNRFTNIHIPTACALVRAWLDSLRGKESVCFTTLQTEILLLHAQGTIASGQRDSWPQLGYLVRLAMTTGLHRGPSDDLNLTVFQSEYRRRLWYGILELDLHMALSYDVPCAVREGEYSCEPPRNLNDEDLFLEATNLAESKPLEQYTASQFTAYAARTLPSRMAAASLISRLGTLQDYSDILEAGAALERMLDDVNFLHHRQASLDIEEEHLEWRTRTLLDIHLRRSLLALYRPFALGSTAASCPSQITSGYLKSSMKLLTYLDEIDPRLLNYEDSLAMYQFVLRNDIIEAAFSVCYFVKITTRVPPRGYWSPNHTEDAVPLVIGSDESLVPWSASSMIQRVERSLERLLGLIRESSIELWDIVALAMVFNSVREGSSEQKLEWSKDWVHRILNVSQQSVKTEAFSFLPALPLVKPSFDRHGKGPHMYANSSSASSIGASMTHEIQDELPFWDAFLESWSPASSGRDPRPF